MVCARRPTLEGFNLLLIADDMFEKEYGKLSEDQFRRLIARLPELRKESTEFDAARASFSKERFREFFPEGFVWGAVYERPFAEHIALLFMALDEGCKYLEVLASSEDPQEKILQDMELLGTDFDPDTWRGGYGGLFNKADVCGLAISLQRTVLSVMLYQRTLSGLVQEVRDTDSSEALFNAVRIDRSIVAAPTIAHRIARAEWRNDKAFFLRLRSAMKGPQQKHWEAYKDLRYSLFALRELGLRDLTDAQLEHLLVRVLKVYPSTPGVAKNLRRQYQLSKKLATT